MNVTDIDIETLAHEIHATFAFTATILGLLLALIVCSVSLRADMTTTGPTD
jgi:hypothetical protein